MTDIPQLYRLPDIMRLLSMSRSTLYEQIRAGRLRVSTWLAAASPSCT
jgi:predicted DNA-binding transcriptional regulator AlpA